MKGVDEGSTLAPLNPWLLLLLTWCAPSTLLRAHSTGRRNKRNSAANQEMFFARSRRYVGHNEWTWAPFWRLISLVKYNEKVQLVRH